jgi:hypothetical protein
MNLRSALFWDITRRHVVIVYRRFPFFIYTFDYLVSSLPYYCCITYIFLPLSSPCCTGSDLAALDRFSPRIPLATLRVPPPPPPKTVLGFLLPICLFLIFIFSVLFAFYLFKYLYNFLPYSYFRGTRWRSWLRHCATNRKVADSIPDVVTGIFH